jgi:sugar-specific transcriptional regulator TrmB
LNKELIINILTSLEFSENEAEIYFFLGRNSPQEIEQIGKSLKLSKKKLSYLLTKLQQKGIVTSSNECPPTFTALGFEEAVNQFIKDKTKQQRYLEENKTMLLSIWKTMLKTHEI